MLSGQIDVLWVLVGWLCLTKSYRSQRRVPTSAMRQCRCFLGPESLKAPAIFLVARRASARQQDLVYNMDHTVFGQDVRNHNVRHLAGTVSDPCTCITCRNAQTLCSEHWFKLVGASRDHSSC